MIVDPNARVRPPPFSFVLLHSHLAKLSQFFFFLIFKVLSIIYQCYRVKLSVPITTHVPEGYACNSCTLPSTQRVRAGVQAASCRLQCGGVLWSGEESRWQMREMQMCCKIVFHLLVKHLLLFIGEYNNNCFAPHMFVGVVWLCFNSQNCLFYEL